jgi:exodeoxyribonuclease V alpha subunit
VCGALAGVVYHNDGFLIGYLDDNTSVLGNMVEPVMGQEYRLLGKWKKHATYGWQFSFSAYIPVTPSDRNGILRYLTRVAKWVGPKTARAIVDKYGDETLSILKNEPERVADEIKGLTLERAMEAKVLLQNNEATEAAIIAVEGFLSKVRGFPRMVANWVITNFGSDAADTIENNPYILTRCPGVGFKLADAAALTNGHARDSKFRQAAALKHVLDEAVSSKGDTIHDLENTLHAASVLTGVDCHAGIDELYEKEAIVFPAEGLVALTRVRNSERAVARIARAMVDSGEFKMPLEIPMEDLEEDQRAAADLLSKTRIGILTGPPGSGKTYALARIVLGLVDAGYGRPAFAAPTGKAAQRMTESLQATMPGAQATTIHRLLRPRISADGFEFEHGSGNPLSTGAVIIDEASMLDVHLAADLLKATTPDMYLLFVGDPDQLPSVGPGSVLKDLMAAGVPTARLDKIKRNAGRIVRACHAVRQGQHFDWSKDVDLEAGENLRHIRRTTAKDIIDLIVKIADTQVRHLGYDPFWDFQAVAPMNEKSEISCKALNDALGGLLNPGELEKGLPFREGDRVVRTKNGVLDHPQLGGPVVNGDMGRISEIDKKYVYVKFQIPERLVAIPRGEHHLLRAYCMTCHRLQGSDAPVIAIPMHPSFGSFPTREWIYTAISRAKDLCLTVGSEAVALNMVNRLGARRRTRLAEYYEEAKR